MKNLSEASWRNLPQEWRGFNLLNWFQWGSPNLSYGRQWPWQEWDFRIISELGFNFVRLPMDYRCWVHDQDARKLDPHKLAPLDDVIKWGEKYGIHISMNFHRAPGYSVNRSWNDGLDLWGNPDTQAIFAEHWAAFSRRFKGVPNERLSFNLVNEPREYGKHNITRESHRQTIGAAVAAIHAEDAERLIIADGTSSGDVIPKELKDLPIAYSFHAYFDPDLSFYGARWWENRRLRDVGKPTWPDESKGWSIDHIREQLSDWRAWKDAGYGVHCGEFGPISTLPYETALPFVEDLLTVMDEYGFGWAVWNFKGAFGPVNSGRVDALQSEMMGMQFDLAMLRALQNHAIKVGNQPLYRV